MSRRMVWRMQGATLGRLVIPAFGALVAIGAVVADPGLPWEIVAMLLAGAAVVAGGLAPDRLGVLTPVAVAGSALAQSSGHHEPGLFLLSLTAMLLVLHRPLSGGWATLIAGVVATPVVFTLLQPQADYAAGIWTLGVALPAALGWAVAHETRLSTELAAARLALVEQHAHEERRRIARDVHDLVGHGLAAMLVQVASARHVLRRDPDAADEALASAEQVGRRGMRELRSTIGHLREVPPPATALPGLVDVEALVNDVQGRGLPVVLAVEPHPDDDAEDPLVGIAVYRIVQEALTNAERHAPRCRTEVSLRRAGDALRVQVLSAGAPPGDPGRGFGVRGMQERAEGVGGRLIAGPTAQGWLVDATLPLGAR